MFIAHVTFCVAPENRKLAIEALRTEVEVVRAMKGCVAFIPFVDPTDAQAVGVMHEWDSSDTFANYISSSSFTSLGQKLRPIMLSPPISKRFDATLIGT